MPIISLRIARGTTRFKLTPTRHHPGLTSAPHHVTPHPALRPQRSGFRPSALRPPRHPVYPCVLACGASLQISRRWSLQIKLGVVKPSGPSPLLWAVMNWRRNDVRTRLCSLIHFPLLLFPLGRPPGPPRPPHRSAAVHNIGDGQAISVGKAVGQEAKGGGAHSLPVQCPGTGCCGPTRTSFKSPHIMVCPLKKEVTRVFFMKTTCSYSRTII